MGKKEKKNKSDTVEKSFKAYIVKGNRQVIQRDVTASKRFMVDDGTYIVKDICIFYKNIDGVLQSVCYYREGNPNPYDFQDVNKGLSSNELDFFYAPDFYTIIVNIQPMNRMRYILLISIFIMMLNLLFMISLLLKEFIL